MARIYRHYPSDLLWTIEREKMMQEYDSEMRIILEKLLANDVDITARAIARLHPTIKAASSITRSEIRRKLLADYQGRQQEYRRWRARVGKQSTVDAAAVITQKEQRIAELEANVRLLTASHVAMLRAVGAMGGFSKWAQFFEKHQEVRNKLLELGAMPDNVMPLYDERIAQRPLSSKKGK